MFWEGGLKMTSHDFLASLDSSALHDLDWATGKDWKTQNSLIYHGWQLVLVLFRSAAEAFHPRSLILLHLNLGEGNGTPLQYSCLENPMDGGAW